jgi:hypothetical protein
MGCTLNALKSVGPKAKGPTVAHTSTPACIQNLDPLPFECRWSALCHLREARRPSIRHRLDGFIRKRASHRGEAQDRTFSSLRSFRWRGTSSILACHRPLPGRASSGSQTSPCASKVRWIPDCRNRKVFDGNSALRSGSGSISLDRKASACGPAPMTWQTCGSQQCSSQWGQRQSTTSSSASTSLIPSHSRIRVGLRV